MIAEIDTWIYLCDKIILQYLTYEVKKDSITHFYKRMLLNGDYKEYIDYKKVDRTHPLVIKYMFENTVKTPSHNKKYFIVTESCYKSLLDRRKYSKQYIFSEKVICDRLSQELGGKREVDVNGKRIDVLTDMEVIEVKKYSNMLSAVGQVLYYSKYYGGRKMRIHLFDHKGCRDDDFEDMCGELCINVTYE
jgi:hypothetical protein